MATSEVLRVILTLDNSQYKREAKETASATGQIATEAQKTGTATGQMRDSLTGVATVAKVAIAGAALLAVKGFVSGSIQAASDLDESMNAVNKIFGEAADKVHAFGDVAARAAGLSKREFNGLATVTGALLTNLGFAQDEAAQASIRLTQRAADMASVFNTDVGTALEAINAGLKGEADPLEQFGVKLNDAAIRAKAVEMGLAETTAAVDDNGKAVASLQLIYEQTDKVAGDFLQTSDGLANAQRIAAAGAENASARWGASFARIAATAQIAASTVLDSIASLTGNEIATASLRMQEAIDAINEAVRDGKDPMSALADALLHLASTGELTGAQFEGLAAQAGLPIDKYEEFTARVLEQGEALGLDKQLLDEMAAAMDTSSVAAEGSAGQIEAQGDAAEIAAQKTQDLLDAHQTYAQILKESLDPVAGAIGAIEDVTEAQANLALVQGDGESTARDIADAQFEYARSILEAQVAIDEIDPSQVTAAIGTLATALDLSEQEARAILEQLGLLDGKQVTTTVFTDYVERGVGSGSDRRFYNRQHGGPFHRGEMFQAGEHNKPELMIIPGDAGQVFSHVDSRRLINALAGNRSGGDTIFQIAGNMDSEAARISNLYAGIQRRIETRR